uniref:Uncharacterized protein n=1 Tax=Stegastes partitus TaxID=144197 RepID=A0A3B4ZSW5_9TELE
LGKKLKTKTCVIVIGPRGWRWFIDLCDTEKQFKTITVLQLKEKIRKRCGYKPGT